VNGSRTPRPSSPRTIFPLLILIVAVVALLVGVAPALAYDGWPHDTATKSKCDIVGCHKDDPATNATCTQAGCHTPGYTTSGSEKCWDCHAPGSAPSASCAGTCHLFGSGGGDGGSSYPTAFTHGATPHLGAAGYGKTCADCHGGGNAHHDAVAGHVPTCAECHNGSLAKVPSAAHADRSANCATCHSGMSLPTCSGCHVGNPSSGGPQIAYSNSPACGDAACHGKITNHVGTPISAAACTTCHASHFEALGTCTKCHADPQSFHHGTARVTPLADCATCHNGSTAAAPTGHQAYGTQCATCHTGMNRPSGDCATCHIGSSTSGAPQVTYTNDLTCADAGCHAKIVTHSGTPITGAACTTCHAPHFEVLGTCTKCHSDPTKFHHGKATATPVVDCAGCHDGTIAPAKQAHAGMSCTSCHTGMARPPVPATCQNCHDAQTFGVVTCTTCHSTSGMIGKETIHATDPAATVSCTTCHEKHYEDLGACKTCHGSHAETHHGTATLADTQLTLVAKPSIIKAHKKATLKGTLLAGGKALAAQKVLIQRKVKGGSYKKVAVVKTGADGRFSRVVRPRVGTEYRAVWRAPGAFAQVQRPAIVTVKLRVRR